MTFRMTPTERRLLQSLGKWCERDHGIECKDDAMREIAEIVKQLRRRLPPLKDKKRQPTRFSLPDQLDRELEAAKDQLGYSKIDMLLLGISAFRRMFQRPAEIDSESWEGPLPWELGIDDPLEEEQVGDSDS